MAARNGPWVAGTDGSDHLHRQKIAPQYLISAENKSRLKWTAFLHLAVGLLMVCRLSTSFLVLFGVRPPKFLQSLHLPRAQLWEYAWLVSVFSAVFALFALRRNRSFLLRQYILGAFTFGLLPVFYAMYDLSDELIDYWKTRETKILFLGFPMVVIWNMFLVIALQLHVFGMYFAWQLIKAWGLRGTATLQKKAK